jgi:nitroimidazol reductase NimA-like FMN-containing flavoprotein (pyridoxamine 5'-phosphate oxidase superfamily)
MPLDPEELEAFLAEPRLCHFATVDQRGRPRVRPIWFLWREGAFHFTTRMEVRHTGRDVAAGSPATISIASEERPYRAVIASGRAEVLGKDEPLLRAISTRYGRREGEAWLAGALKEPDRVALRLVPEELLSWDYAKGDYRKQNQGVTMRTLMV